MRKYLELFVNGFDETITDKIKVENKPYIGYSLTEGKLAYTVVPTKEEEPEIDLTIPYVTFTAEEDNSSIGLEKLSTNQTLEYSTDTTIWNTFNTATNIPLNNGDKVYVRGVLSANNGEYNYTQFKMTGKIAASGNCNAIWNYEDLNAPLKAYCGFDMFRGCSSLTTAPELPATKLENARSCYHYMFYGCTSLITVPELPATVLDQHCYHYMFFGCTSLTTAQKILPATKLTYADFCYENMFERCTSLTTAPELPATKLGGQCYGYMFRRCTSLTTAPELPATELTNYCYNYMFDGCTSLTTAPELPATKLAYGCYENMFSNCTNLNHITCLATNISASICVSNWTKGVASTGTFVKHSDMNNWSTGTSGIPSGWTVVDAEL